MYTCTLRKNNEPLLPEGTIRCTHHRKFTDNANKNRQNRCYFQSKNFLGTSDTIRHLKTFKMASNKMPNLLLILCWCYLSCLQKYSEKILNIDFHEQIFFQIFVAKGDTC